MASIKELAEKKARLEAELADVKSEIAARAGEPPEPEPDQAPAKKSTRKG